MSKLTAACMLGFCALAMAAPATAAPRPDLAPAPRDALTRALVEGRLTEAAYALERARSLFALDEVRDEFGRVAAPSPHDATPILRDLAARAFLLRGDHRAQARTLLARPGSSQTACDVARSLCFHWTTGGSRHATSPSDVNATMQTFADVWDLEVATYGYLAPLPDLASPDDGGSGATDVYLRDLGGNAVPLFGYCTTDDPNSDSSYPYTDVSAYCVLDNNFSQAQFGSSQTPQAFRDVTAAHEFFHAIQFAYDWLEDLWLMEGTAMLMEGQFRPDIDDRVRYLDNSVLTWPLTPVDRGADGFEYGAWIYWRFLVERFAELINPVVIREVWERAAGASTDTDGAGPDTTEDNLYSLLATRRVLASRGGWFRALFAEFARVNRVPATFYAEGASYPSAPSAIRRMSRGETTGWRSPRLRHLSSVYHAFRPATGQTSATLRLVVDLPKPSRGPEAGVIIHRANGDVVMRKIALDATGRGAMTVGFGYGTISRVDLVLTNASPRMSCNRGTPYSCAGAGVDDLGTYAYRASAR